MNIKNIVIVLLVSMSVQLSAMDKSKLNKDLLDAALEGDVQKVEQCIKDGAQVNCTPDGSGLTPLTAAIMLSQNLKIVQMLMKHKDIDPNKKLNSTPLSLAVQLNKIEMVKALLKHADTDPNMQNPLKMAAQGIWHDKTSKYNPLIATHLLIHPKIKINKDDDEGVGPLFFMGYKYCDDHQWVHSKEHDEILKLNALLLINRGAKVTNQIRWFLGLLGKEYNFLKKDDKTKDEKDAFLKLLDGQFKKVFGKK